MVDILFISLFKKGNKTLMEIVMRVVVIGA